MEIYVGYLIVLSIAAFTAYAVDKKRAVDGRWRIPENFLLGLSFFGGGVGGYLSMFLFRHKIRKPKFQIVNLLSIVWQVGLCVAIARGLF